MFDSKNSIYIYIYMDRERQRERERICKIKGNKLKGRNPSNTLEIYMNICLCIHHIGVCTYI